MRNFILRLLIITLTSIVLFVLKEFMYYDFLVAFLLLISLILNYKTTEEKIDVISNYIFWLTFAVLIYVFKNLDVFDSGNTLIYMLMLKIIVLCVSYLKYKKINIKSSYLSKFWILVLFLFLCEVILNSTFGLKNACFILGVISSFESLCHLFRNKDSNLDNVPN